MPNCLVVEHDPIIAADLYMILDDYGFDVDGPFGNLDTVSAHIQDKSYDFATLDIRFMGESVYPVAKTLVSKNIPFIYVTGTTKDDPLRVGLPKADILVKPFLEKDLLALMRKNLKSLKTAA